MAKSAEKSQLHGIEEILSSKARGAALNEEEQKIVHRAIGAALNTEIKKSIDLFARRVADPHLRLVKALKAAGGKDRLLKPPGRGQVQQAEPPPSLSRAGMGQPTSGGVLPLARGIPGPWSPLDWRETQPVHRPPWATGWGPWESQPLPPLFYVKYTPPYPGTGIWPTEQDLAVDQGFWGAEYDTRAQVIQADVEDGNLSIAGVVGRNLGLAKGYETFPFGDATIPYAALWQTVNIPAYSTARVVGLGVDVTVGNGGPPSTALEVNSENGVVGVWGYISLVIGSGEPVSQVFLNTWAANLSGQPTPAPPLFWMPGPFPFSGSFSVPAKTTILSVLVATWGVAFRVTAVDGYDQDAAGFEFLDFAKVKHHALVPYSALNPDPGPIHISDIIVSVV